MTLTLTHPCPGSWPTSPFGWRGAVPGVPHSIPLFHDAQDYAAPSGTPLYAAMNGVISENGFQYGGLGNYVKIRRGIYTLTYGHMLNRSPLKVGTTVKANQQIGKVGSTGASTGPHVHFGLAIGSKAVDPVPFINKKRKRTMKKYLTKDKRKRIVLKPGQYTYLNNANVIGGAGDYFIDTGFYCEASPDDIIMIRPQKFRGKDSYYGNQTHHRMGRTGVLKSSVMHLVSAIKGDRVHIKIQASTRNKKPVVITHAFSKAWTIE